MKLKKLALVVSCALGIAALSSTADAYWRHGSWNGNGYRNVHVNGNFYRNGYYRNGNVYRGNVYRSNGYYYRNTNRGNYWVRGHYSGRYWVPGHRVY